LIGNEPLTDILNEFFGMWERKNTITMS
jgi:hypothetical protein